jgi:hypothetical protein
VAVKSPDECDYPNIIAMTSRSPVQQAEWEVARTYCQYRSYGPIIVWYRYYVPILVQHVLLLLIIIKAHVFCDLTGYSSLQMLLKSSYEETSNNMDTKRGKSIKTNSFLEIPKFLGREGRTIDVFKIDLNVMSVCRRVVVGHCCCCWCLLLLDY